MSRAAAMRMLGAIVLVFAAGSVASPGYAWDMAGVGGRSCAQFGHDYQRAPGAMDTFYFSWAQGYLTAVDTLLLGLKRGPINLLPHSMLVPEQREFIRDWCASHPLDQYMTAVIKLIETLRANPGDAPPRP